MKSKAILKYSRISPQKVRLVADLIQNQPVERAIGNLKFTPKRAARILEKVLHSAISNAANNPDVGSVDDLFVSRIYVNSGPTLKRFRPCSMGRAHRIRKRTSHITIELDELTAVKGGLDLGPKG